MAESFALIVTRKLRWQLAVRRKDDWRRNWKPREGAEENSVLKLLTQFSPCISACFFNFLIFVIATCSFFFELYLRRKNWWDVMIYIYIFSFQARWRRGKTRCSEIWGATTTSWKAKAAPGLQHSDHFQAKFGPPIFFFGRFCYVNIWITMENLMSLFFKSQPTNKSVPCCFSTNQRI